MLGDEPPPPDLHLSWRNKNSDAKENRTYSNNSCFHMPSQVLKSALIHSDYFRNPLIFFFFSYKNFSLHIISSLYANTPSDRTKYNKINIFIIANHRILYNLCRNNPTTLLQSFLSCQNNLHVFISQQERHQPDNIQRLCCLKTNQHTILII